MRHNALGQPIGDAVAGWSPRPLPSATTLAGDSCRLERLDADRHAEALFAVDRADARGESWTYLPYGPFTEYAPYRRWVEEAAASGDPRFYAIVDAAGGPLGVLSLLRVQPDAGSLEVGHVHYSPALLRRRAGTEAQYLLLRYAFEDLGYRRYEWKCDALNAPSRAAAERLGFRYEGTFRQAAVVKGSNRDTAWYSILDVEWPLVGARLRAWLDPGNFDEQGRQRASLSGVSSR